MTATVSHLPASRQRAVDTAPIDIAAHPSIGPDRGVVVTELSATRFRIAAGDRVVGFVESAGPVWVAHSGAVAAWAVEVAQHRTFGGALRELVAASIDEPVA